MLGKPGDFITFRRRVAQIVIFQAYIIPLDLEFLCVYNQF